MAAKQSFKLYVKNDRQGQKKRQWLIKIIFIVTLFLTTLNLVIAYNSIQNQFLVALPSEVFHSSKYQPIVVGDARKIARQDFSKIDRIAKFMNYSGASIEELAQRLEQNTTTETEEARIIYAWITQHIAYDLNAYNDAVYNDKYPDVEATTVLQNRTTICSGYSNLYLALAEAMNLESVMVVGHAKGATPADMERFYDVNHSWNGVRIDGEWYLLDATWGAGAIVEDRFTFNYKPYYFATAPEELINNHFPKDEGWQLLAQTHTRKNFDNAIDISDRFYTLGLELDSHQKRHISTSGRLEIKLKAPQDILAVASLQQEGQELPEETVLVNRQEEYLEIDIAPPAAGIYDLIIYAKDKNDPNAYEKAIAYQIKAKRSTAQFPIVYQQFHQYQANLVEPSTTKLDIGRSAYFNLIIPEAIEVMVVNPTAKSWTPLDGYGDSFVGHVDIESGSSFVVAKFSDSDEYWKLIEYNSN